MQYTEQQLTADQVSEEVRDFLKQNFIFAEDDLPADASLTESGVIDSMGVMEVVLFLEERFGIAIEDDEVVAENFDSIGGLVSYVQRKAA